MNTEQVLKGILISYGNLPPRPGMAEVQEAEAALEGFKKEYEEGVSIIDEQPKGRMVANEVFTVFQDMQKHALHHNISMKEKDALKVMDIEKMHLKFDDFIQIVASHLSVEDGRTSNLTATGASSSRLSLGRLHEIERISRGGSEVTRPTRLLRSRSFGSWEVGESSGSRDHEITPEGEDAEMLSMDSLKSALIIAYWKDAKELKLQGRLTNEVECLHDDKIKNLTSLITLNMSMNNLLVLPDSIGVLSSLKNLDLRSNKIVQLPESIGDLVNLVIFNLSSNALESLPNSIEKLHHLQEFDLCYNHLQRLPYTIGSLRKLQKLDLSHNHLVHIPYTICNCYSLKELCASYNKLKSLPHSIGGIATLELVLVSHNEIKKIPETLGLAVRLKEVDFSVNQLASVPATLCSSTTLVKLNISNNFGCLNNLPPSFGELVNLEELDMSSNQIRYLPESFSKLSKLRVLDAAQNPLECPPPDVITNGAEAVVEYMATHPYSRQKKMSNSFSKMMLCTASSSGTAE